MLAYEELELYLREDQLSPGYGTHDFLRQSLFFWVQLGNDVSHRVVPDVGVHIVPSQTFNHLDHFALQLINLLLGLSLS